MNKSFWMFEKCSELGHTRTEETEMDFRYDQEGNLEKGKQPRSFEEAINSAKLANQKYNTDSNRKRELEMITEYDEYMILLQFHEIETEKKAPVLL